MKKVGLFIILFFTLTARVFASENINYDLYLKNSSVLNESMGSIPRDYTIYYDHNFNLYEKEKTLSKAAPSSYDMRKDIDITVPNQGAYNTCYAVAALNSLEYTIYKANSNYFDFSVMHAEYMSLKENGGTRNTYNGGGNFRSVADYLLKGDGPVLTTSVPYQSYSDITSWASLPILKNITNVVEYPTIDKYNSYYSGDSLNSFRDKIKNHLLNHGPLSAVIYAGASSVATTITTSLNKNSDGSYDNVLYYPKQASNTQSSNHAITIIGWDDNYSKTNFPENNRPSSNGAYLVMNSWGSYMPFIWVSYEDIWIEYEISGFTYDDIKDNSTYNEYNIAKNTTSEMEYNAGYYTSDYLYAYYGNTQDHTDTLHTIYLGNKYSRDASVNETVNEVLFPFYFYTSEKQATATVYMNPSNSSFSNLIEIGTISNATSNGMYKLILDNPVKLTGSSYSIVVKMNSVYTFRTLFSGSSSYISNSLNGEYVPLQDLATGSSAIFPMIIRTDITNEYQLQTINLNHLNTLTANGDNIYRLPLKVNKTGAGKSNVNILITLNGFNKTADFDILGTTLFENKAMLRIKAHDNISNGTYILKISYQDSDPIYTSFIISNKSYLQYPNLFSNEYSINYNYISNIKPETVITNYQKSFSLSNKYNLKIYDRFDEEITAGNIGTGSKLKYYNNDLLEEEFTNVVKGDTTGDAKVNVIDILKIAKYIDDVGGKGTSTLLSKYEKVAADTTQDDKINVIDILKIARAIDEAVSISNGKEVSTQVGL